MKKLLTIFPITAALLALLAWPVLAQTTPPELADIDTEVNDWLPRAATYQTDYKTTNGKYYQLLWSHTEPITQPTIPNNLGLAPNDQLETGYNFWLLAQMPVTPTYRLKIDTYNGLQGDGYVMTLQTVLTGTLWQRSLNFGPETYRNNNWFMVPDDDF